MLKQIHVLGFTTTNTKSGTQYTLLTQTGTKYYDYIFTPEGPNTHSLRINPTVDKNTEMQPLTQSTLQWKGTQLILQNEKTAVLYDNESHIFTPPTTSFTDEVELLPKRIVMIVTNCCDEMVPFISPYKSIVYTDSWDTLPAVIPEDVIVLGIKPFPLKDIVFRLPQRTKAVIVNGQTQE